MSSLAADLGAQCRRWGTGRHVQGNAGPCIDARTAQEALAFPQPSQDVLPHESACLLGFPLRRCCVALQLPALEEIEAMLAGRKQTAIVFFLDETFEELEFDATSTVLEAVEYLAGRHQAAELPDVHPL